MDRLYPGYGLALKDELRRHVYSVLINIGIAAIIILALQLVGVIWGLWLVLYFGGLLLLAPIARYITKWGLKNGGLMLSNGDGA